MAATEKTGPKPARTRKPAQKPHTRAEVRDKSVTGRTQQAGVRLAARLAGRVNSFQRRTFERVTETFGELQDKTGERVHKLAANSKWVPREGTELIAEWNKAVKQTRQSFEKSALKTFDLMEGLYERVEKKNTPKKSAKPEKRAPAKRHAETAGMSPMETGTPMPM